VTGLVLLGADRAPSTPSCAFCGSAIAGSARLVGGRKLAHPSCAAVAGPEACSVCELVGFDPLELDSSGRCDRCRP
jgi:hypothetical protein